MWTTAELSACEYDVNMNRKPDAGNPHVRFVERDVETEVMARTEAPPPLGKPGGNSYSPRLQLTAPHLDSTGREEHRRAMALVVMRLSADFAHAQGQTGLSPL